MRASLRIGAVVSSSTKASLRRLFINEMDEPVARREAGRIERTLPVIVAPAGCPYVDRHRYVWTSDSRVSYS